MKSFKLFSPLFLLLFVFSACTKDDVAPETVEKEPEEELRNLEVENFMWRGMEEIYLYKADIPELDRSYFATQAEKDSYLSSFADPDELFHDGLKSHQDKFSFYYDDYVALEKMFGGISTTNGIQMALYRYGSEEGVMGVVNYVLPNTSAEEAGVKRGDIFIRVDGTLMTTGNYQDLLGSNTYDIEISYIDENTITSTGRTVTLTKAEYSSNPVYKTEILEVDGAKVGYLMYNSFTDTYDADLNAAFAEFKGAGITDLVLDLRYNGGGSVSTAVALAGMITGQFTGEIFLREQWNERYQNAWDPESYYYRFSDKVVLNRNEENETVELLNSLNLTKVYVLTTKSTASASELIINGLEPYIDVVQIGTNTTGKFQASVTLYDSNNFGRTGANPNHTYAIQPLVFKSANVDGKSDYVDGLFPDIEITEDLGNMGQLGDPAEPFLNAALNHITGAAQKHMQIEKAREFSANFDYVGETGIENPNFQKMYIDELPHLGKK